MMWVNGGDIPFSPCWLDNNIGVQFQDLVDRQQLDC